MEVKTNVRSTYLEIRHGYVYENTIQKYSHYCMQHKKQALRTNCVKHYIDKSAESPLCRMYGEKAETTAQCQQDSKERIQTTTRQRYKTCALEFMQKKATMECKYPNDATEARKRGIVVVYKENASSLALLHQVNVGIVARRKTVWRNIEILKGKPDGFGTCEV